MQRLFGLPLALGFNVGVLFGAVCYQQSMFPVMIHLICTLVVLAAIIFGTSPREWKKNDPA